MVVYGTVYAVWYLYLLTLLAAFHLPTGTKNREQRTENNKQ